MSDAFSLDYSDNHDITVGDRLGAEINADPTSLDVVTGYLTPTVWNIVGPALDQLGSLRLLLGKDYELDRHGRAREEVAVRALVREAIRDDTQPPGLPTTLDAAAIEGLIDFLRQERTQVKVWTDGFLHAKAYLLRGSVGVGSANFTGGGLSANKELVAWRQDKSVVRQLHDWFERNWNDPVSEDYKDELVALLEASRFGGYPWTPYDLFVRTLAQRYGTEKPPSLSQATFNLKWFQEDAVFRLIKLLDGPARGALLADAVGLGKTYMALGVIHHFLYQHAGERTGRGRPVTLVVPASLEDMWTRELASHGLDWACNVVTVQSLRAGADLAPYQQSDLIVIDEAHRLRGGRVWFQQAMEIVAGGAEDKRVLLLTATPLQTSIRDLTNLLRIITKNHRNVWAPAIADFERYLKRVEKRDADPFPLLDRSLIRRSRSDLIEAFQERRKAGVATEEPKLPKRQLGHVRYSYFTGDGGADVFGTFVTTVTHLSLAPYDLSRFNAAGLAAGVTPGPSSLAGLYIAGLLKRFESSLRAVRLSLNRLERLLTRFVQALESDPPRLLNVAGDRAIRDLLEIDEDEDDVVSLDEAWDRAIDALPVMTNVAEFDLGAIKAASAEDIEGVRALIASLPDEASDGKVFALVDLLTNASPPKGSPKLVDKRALVFSQYRDTAEYVYERLALVPQLANMVLLVHGGSTTEQRRSVAAWFDPDRADEFAAKKLAGEEEPLVLVATDVLAEGHNLQLAQAVVNFDLHWNPQVAVQRAGRIDRLNSPHATVSLISFLPDEGLDAHLGLLHVLDERFNLIHHLGLGDEPVTPLPGDRQSVTFDYLRRLYADEVSVLDEIERAFTLGSTDYMRAPLEAFILNAGIDRLNQIPVGVQSVKALPAEWQHGPGAFVALQSGDESIWRFYPRLPDGSWGAPVTDEVALFGVIACTSGEPRLTDPTSPPGPGGVIDWDLLRRSAEEVALELSMRRATADIAKGASERSSKTRQRLNESASGVELDDLDLLLDRLEQVRVEDFDHKEGFGTFEDKLRAAHREEDIDLRRALVLEVVQRGLELFGHPEGEVPSAPVEVKATDLTLVSWEALTERGAVARIDSTQEQLQV